MDGENLHAQNRKRFWRTLGIAFVALVGSLGGCKSLSPPLCFAPGPGCPNPMYDVDDESSRDILSQIDE